MARRFLDECSGLRTRLLDVEGKDHFAAGARGSSTLAISEARVATITDAARRWALPDCSGTAAPSLPALDILQADSTSIDGVLPSTGWPLAVGGGEIGLALSPFAITAASAGYGVAGLARELYPQTNNTVLRVDIPSVAQDDPPMAELELAVPSNRLANASLSRLREQRDTAARSLACPYGHAIPEFVSEKSEIMNSVQWLEGTACAALCPVPWTPPSVHRQLQAETCITLQLLWFLWVFASVPNMLFRENYVGATALVCFFTTWTFVWKTLLMLSRLPTLAVVFQGAAISREDWMRHQNSQFCLNNVEGRTVFDWQPSGCGVLYFFMLIMT